MKIGILTFHNAHNYGAVLQAYALKSILTASGYTVHIINYKNQKINKRYQKKLKLNPSRREIVFPWRWKALYQRYLANAYAQKAWENQWTKFQEFINHYLLAGDSRIIERHEIQNLGYDALICGSDQVWNSELTGGLDQAYVMDLDVTCKKIAYAVSSKRVMTNKEELAYLKQCLTSFCGISTRENLLSIRLSDLLGSKVKTVLDPTMLLNTGNYEKLEQKVALAGVADNEYVFAYYLSEEKELAQCAKAIAEQLHLPIIELHYYFRKGMEAGRQRADFGPGEFLYLVHHAKYIITNSFHGTVFSILYKKQFYSVYEEDMRKQELLNQFGLQDRHIENAKQADITNRISYDRVFAQLEILKEESIQFLEQSLL